MVLLIYIINKIVDFHVYASGSWCNASHRLKNQKKERCLGYALLRTPVTSESDSSVNVVGGGRVTGRQEYGRNTPGTQDTYNPEEGRRESSRGGALVYIRTDTLWKQK